MVSTEYKSVQLQTYAQKKRHVRIYFSFIYCKVKQTCGGHVSIKYSVVCFVNTSKTFFYIIMWYIERKKWEKKKKIEKKSSQRVCFLLQRKLEEKRAKWRDGRAVYECNLFSHCCLYLFIPRYKLFKIQSPCHEAANLCASSKRVYYNMFAR